MSLKQDVPAMDPVNVNLDEDSVPTVAGREYEIFSWSPGRVSEGVPCTEVHLSCTVRTDEHDAMRVTWRLKSPRALDELVAVLLQHRRYVWGPK